MIQLTGMNREGFTLNAEHIEKLNRYQKFNHLSKWQKYIVTETPDEIIEKVKNTKVT
ncbi:flagellar FlbD family protein [Clostridium botulinum]|nr:flagellar FlbD family protein [Clostridium botulinum]